VLLSGPPGGHLFIPLHEPWTKSPAFSVSGDVHFDNLDASGAGMVSSWTDSSTYGEMDRTTARLPFNAVRKVDIDAGTSAVSDLWS
jgi:hypothetical protein